jgi:DNA-binding transcriptional LysR family regulator
MWARVNGPFMDPNDDGLRLQDLELFVAVAETGGFTAAAARLGVSKATVSVAVARLEAQLGVRLFHRSSRRVAPTEAGLAALPHARRALDAARDAAEAAREGLAAPRGVLRLDVPHSFGLLYVMPVVNRFLVRYPEVTVDLVLDDRPLDLVAGGFDLALRIGTLADSGLVAQRIAPIAGVLVAHPAYLDRRGRPEEPRDLAGHDTLVYSLSPTGARWPVQRGGRTEEVVATPRLRATSSLALLQAVREGLGVARMPRFVVAEDLAAGRLERVLPGWDMPSLGLYALTTAREGSPRKTAAFLELFRDWIGSPPRWDRPTP